MQDRYAGDVGDFMKLGLLRHLVGPTDSGGTGLSIAINWYRAPEESHNADGKHIGYLLPGNRWHRPLERCDPDLMVRLQQVVALDRSVERLENCGAVPADCRTYGKMLPARGEPGRAEWHAAALEALEGADVVFADPDNGLHDEPGASSRHKFALISELAAYGQRAQGLVVYHHADRSAGGVEAQARRRLEQLEEGTGQPAVGAVIARRGTCRIFLITAPETHYARLTASLDAYGHRWGPHAALIWPHARQRDAVRPSDRGADRASPPPREAPPRISGSDGGFVWRPGELVAVGDEEAASRATRTVRSTAARVSQINVTLDEERAAKLAALADRIHVEEEAVARSLLSRALDAADADPEHTGAGRPPELADRGDDAIRCSRDPEARY